MRTWCRKTAARSVVGLGAVAALTIGVAAPAGATNHELPDLTDPMAYYKYPEWVVNPDNYWMPGTDCVHFTEAFDPPWDPFPAGHPDPQGKGEITYSSGCATEDAELTAWIKGKPYPMQYGSYRTYFHGGAWHWIDYDCLAVGTPVLIEGSYAFDVTMPEQTVRVTERIHEWDNADELFRYDALPARCGNPSVFTDIGPGVTFYEHIHWAARNGITTGWRDGTYRPHATITRDVMAAYLARWGKIPTVAKIGGENNFNIDWRRWEPSIRSTYSDMPPTRIFSVEVSLLSQIGVINGWADGTFRPDQNVTRDQTAAFLYRLAGSPAYTPPKTPRFKDVRPGAVFYKEISWLADSGFSTGWADGTFRPGASIHRDEMAAILHRFEKVYSGANRGNGIVK